MIIFAHRNNNNTANKDSKNLAYMQIDNYLNQTAEQNDESLMGLLGGDDQCLDEVIFRKPVAETLRALKVGEEALFPIEQRTTIRVTNNRITAELIRQRWRCEIDYDEENYLVKVHRVS